MLYLYSSVWKSEVAACSFHLLTHYVYLPIRNIQTCDSGMNSKQNVLLQASHRRLRNSNIATRFLSPCKSSLLTLIHCKRKLEEAQRTHSIPSGPVALHLHATKPWQKASESCFTFFFFLFLKKKSHLSRLWEPNHSTFKDFLPNDFESTLRSSVKDA